MSANPNIAPAIARQAEAAQLALEILWALARVADLRPSLPDDSICTVTLGQCRKARHALRQMAAESRGEPVQPHHAAAE